MRWINHRSAAAEAIRLAQASQVPKMTGMRTNPRLDIIGAALADPSRSRILCELMDGRAFTNKELAAAAGIAPQTATAHLKQLQACGLTRSLRSGRHIYHQLAGEEVATALEALAGLSPTDHIRRGRNGRDGDALKARSCYNHIAGRLGVLIAERLLATGVLVLRDGGLAAGPRYQSFCADAGLELPPRAGQPVARFCLDWTERRHHISGRLATAILDAALDRGWVERVTGSRALYLTPEGQGGLARMIGLDPDALREFGR